jgi:hypothetical protein
MKGVLPWSVHLARCSGNTDFYPAFPALISLVQTFFSQYIISLYVFTATWAGSRAGSAVS